MSVTPWGPLGGRKLACVYPVSMWKSWPMHQGELSWRGAVCVYVGLEAVPAASVLCVTLPSRGQVLSDPREPQPKLQRGWGRQQSGPRGLSSGDCWSPVGSCLGNEKATVTSCLTPSHCRQPFCFPNALCLGTLPQNMQYVWVTCPTPTRAAPTSPGCGCPGPPSAAPAHLSSH